MDGSPVSQRFASMIDDRPDDGMFRIDRSIYTDEAVSRAEFENIFERGWVFLCHDSQVPGHGDYFATEIGRQPVFVIRQKDGSLGCFINACSHRGAILTPLKQGNAKVITCRFHGWSYGCDGHCIKIKEQATGFPDDGFDRGRFDLRAIARLDSYRGFVFGSLSADSPDLAEHLGQTTPWIDLLVDQALDGLEVVPGSSTYVIDGNWKMQAENSVDGYHVSTVHRVFASTISNRESKDEYTGMKKTESGRITGRVDSRGYDLGNGHMAIWADRASPDAAPLYPATERIERDFPAARAKWMLKRGRNILVFPNLVLNDLASTHMRTHRPLGPGRCEVTIWCIAPKGEPAEARAARLRKFEDFFLVTGLATSDDVVSLDTAQAGSYGGAAGWNEFTRGITTFTAGPDDAARELGLDPVSSGATWDSENTYIGFYRHWRDLLSASPSAAHTSGP